MICADCHVAPCACVSKRPECAQCEPRADGTPEPGERGPCPYRQEIFGKDEDCSLDCCGACRDECVEDI